MAGDGIALGFDESAFLDGIYTAMVMGTPGSVFDRAIFSWSKEATYTPEDPGRRPYDWHQTPVTDVTPDPVTLDKVAVEFSSSVSQDTTVGGFTPQRAKLTLLDTEYALVEGADVVSLGGSAYDIRYVNTQNLFGVAVYEMNCERQ